MKKTLAVLLSVLMVISSITCIFTVTTVQAETEVVSTELISNGDFENLTLNPVGVNASGINGKTDATTIFNEKWYRADYGKSYADYGDLSDYDAEYDDPFSAKDDEYAKYFSPCSTVVVQPDDATNHIARANQTFLQAIKIANGKYVFKFKVRALAETSHVEIGLKGLQQDANSKTTVYLYDKFNINVVEAKGNFTYVDTTNDIKITLDNNEEWTNVELVVEVSEIENPVSSKPNETIIETDFTMLRFNHPNISLSTVSETKGANYKKTGIYLDDVSIKTCANDPFGEAEFYKDSEKLENPNEGARITKTVNGEEVSTFALGDTVTATAEELDGIVFGGWYKNGEFLTNDTTIDIVLNNIDTYTPRFYIAYDNILNDTAASFEGFAKGADLEDTTNATFPEVGEWGSNRNSGYFGATYEGVIYDIEGNAYNQVANDVTPEAVSGNLSAVVDDTYAYSGKHSLKIKCNSRVAVTALDVVPNTNYTLTYYVKGVDTAAINSFTTAIVTTVNLGNTSIPTAVDPNNAPYLSDLSEAYVAQMKKAVTLKSTIIKTMSGDWEKIEFVFNSGNFETLYLALKQPTNTSAVYYVDNLNLVAEAQDEAVEIRVVDKNGDSVAEDVAANAAVTTTVEKDIYSGVKTATVNYQLGAYTFLGWFEKELDTLVYSEKVIDDTEYSLDELYAKVQNNNLLTYAGSYEKYTNGHSLKYAGTDYPSGEFFGCNVNDGYLGTTVAETIYDKDGNAIEQVASGATVTNAVNAVVTNEYAHSGNNSVKIPNNFRVASMGIDVKPNTDYSLSYWILAPKNDAENLINTVALSAIVTTLNCGTGGTAPANKGLNTVPEIRLDTRHIADSHNGETWIKITHTFNSMNLNKVYFILGQTTYSASGYKASVAYIDDLIMFENPGVAGDNNNDGKTNLKDLVNLARFVADWEVTNVNEYAMDANKNNEIALDDVNFLSKHLAGWNGYGIR